jgi:hypothetical protein
MREICPMVSILAPYNLIKQSLQCLSFHRQKKSEQNSKLRQRNGRCFFPKPAFQVPKKKVREDASLYVMMPAHILSDFIVVHAQLCLGLLKTLLNGSAQSAYPDKGFETDIG